MILLMLSTTKNATDYSSKRTYTTRAQYLYDKVRKCVHCASNRDKVCPKPNPSEQPNTDNPTVNITEREEVDVLGPPTHNSTLSSMYSTYIKRGRQVKTVIPCWCEKEEEIGVGIQVSMPTMPQKVCKLSSTVFS